MTNSTSEEQLAFREEALSTINSHHGDLASLAAKIAALKIKYFGGGK